MRAPDTQDMGLWKRNHLYDENKSVRALFGQLVFSLSIMYGIVRVFVSSRPLELSRPSQVEQR